MQHTLRAAALVIATLAGGAHAASFDCKAANSTTEKAICGSPRLSALDEQLAHEYGRALAALSPAGADSLKQSQRSWLRFATQVCTPAKRAARNTRDVASCLEHEFAGRLDQLAQAGLRIGPYVFNRVDAWASAHARDDLGSHPGFNYDRVAYAQIDAPATPAARAWNAAQRKDTPAAIAASSDPDEPVEDDDTDYTIGCVGDRFISLRVDGREYIHGTPHGTYDHQVRNALLVPAYRKMVATDIFAAGAGWKATLPAMFVSAWTKDSGDGDSAPSTKETIEAAAADPERWLLTPAGLQISFDDGENGCHACDPGPITVPWAALKPMLAAPDLATCKAPPTVERP